MEKRKRIVFYGNIYSATNGMPAGGGERQIALMAKAFTNLNYDVTVLDFELTETRKVDNITFIGLKNDSNNGSLFSNFRKELRDAEANIYYGRVRGFIHIYSYFAAKKNKALFVLSLASNLDVSGFSERYKYYYRFRSLAHFFTSGILSEIVFNYLVKHADVIACQNNFQKQKAILLNKNSIIVKNIFDTGNLESKKGDEELKEISDNDYYVFIGSLDRRKGFEEFTEIARQVKNRKILVIGQPRDEFARLAIKDVQLNENVNFLGNRLHDDVLKIISNALGIIVTSKMEGFPNVFLEAWYFGVPVFSLNLDVDDLLSSEKFGLFFNGNTGKMIEYLKSPDKIFDKKTMTDYVLNDHSAVNAKKLADYCEAVNKR